MCHIQVHATPTKATTAAATTDSADRSSPTETKSTSPAQEPSTELPAFEDFAIFAAMALFHWAVCLGFVIAAILAPVLARVKGAATIVSVALFRNLTRLAFSATATLAPALARLATRVIMGLCAVARHAQQEATRLAPRTTTKATTTTPAPTTAPKAVKWTTTTATPTAQTTSSSPKASPARRATVTRGPAECVLFWSSHVVDAEQRAAINHARRILRDALVVFDEIDLACLVDDQLENVLRNTGAPAGVYPLVFVGTPQTQTQTQTAAPTAATTTALTTSLTTGLIATSTSISTLTKMLTTATPTPPTWIQCITMEQLTTAEFFSEYTLEELAQVDAVAESALFLFHDVSTRCQPAHTFDAQLHALGGSVLMRDALYSPWRLPVDMRWARCMFEDACDVYTAIKLYSLMP